MCGRFVQALDGAQLRKLLGWRPRGELPGKRYNIAPGTKIKLLRSAAGDGDKVSGSANADEATLTWAQHPWGFQSGPKAPLLINARSETAAEKASFAAAWRSQRALVPVSGFYEWERKGKQRQPYYIFQENGQPLLIAALLLGSGAEHSACVLLTKEANTTVGQIHHRMPFCIEPTAVRAWLDDGGAGAVAAADVRLALHPVSPSVNKPTFDEAACLDAYTPPEDPQLALF